MNQFSILTFSSSPLLSFCLFYTAMADCGMDALGAAVAACGEGPMMKMIKSGEITPLPGGGCPPIDVFQALLGEIAGSFDCLLTEAGWMHNGVPEDAKIRGFLDNLPTPGGDIMAVCIRETREAGKAVLATCDTAGIAHEDLLALQRNNEAAVRLFCLNEQLLNNHCIPATQEMTRIQAVLNPHH